MQDFHYEIIPVHHVCDTKKDLFNKVFEMWENTFSSVATEADSELDFSDFFRCHSIGVIRYQDEVVGFNLFTIFDLTLRAHLQHPYLKHLDSTTLESMKDRACTRVLTMEYFTVGMKWRRKYKNVPWAEVLTGLGLQYTDQSPAHGVLGTPRVDLKVDQMCYRLGAKPLQGSVQKLNIECAVVLFEKEEHRHFLNPETHFWVKRLWKSYLRDKLAAQELATQELYRRWKSPAVDENKNPVFEKEKVLA